MTTEELVIKLLDEMIEILKDLRDQQQKIIDRLEEF